MHTFTYTWIGNISLIFHDTASGNEYEVRFFGHNHEVDTIEAGLIAQNYFNNGVRGPIYFTDMSPSDDIDLMKLFLAEMLKFQDSQKREPNLDEINIREQSPLP